MKKIISALSIAASLIFLTFGLALAGPAIHYDQIITGVNNASSDVGAVQNAVNQGGKILLKGTFDFGMTRVYIRNKPDGTLNEVEICGETDKKGDPLTKIKGGFFSFYSPLPVSGTPPSLPDLLPPGPKITIQDIHFEGALWAPIHIAYTSEATISRNKITSVVPYGPGLFDPSFPDFKYLSAGIYCGTWFAQSSFSPVRIYREGAVTGQLKINNNYIDLEFSAPENNLGQGIFVNWTTGIVAKISGNIIKSVSRNSIEVLDNYLADGIGAIVMEGNEITTSEVGIRYPSGFTPNGIVFGWYLNPAGNEKTKNCLHTVMQNSIRIKGETSVGIMALADSSVVLNNQIVSEGATARGLWIVGSHGYIAHNKIEGIGNCAIDVSPTDPTAPLRLDAGYNFFQGNNYNFFNAALYDLHFAKGADHNVFVGHSGHVSDEGIDNRITNFNFPFLGKASTLGPKSFYRLNGQRGW